MTDDQKADAAAARKVAVMAAGAKVAEKMALRLQKAYETSVETYWETYDELPDEDDFFAWVEGYGWEE